MLMMGVGLWWIGGGGTGIEAVSVSNLEGRLREAVENHAPGVAFGAVWREETTIVRAAGLANLETG